MHTTSLSGRLPTARWSRAPPEIAQSRAHMWQQPRAWRDVSRLPVRLFKLCPKVHSIMQKAPACAGCVWSPPPSHHHAGAPAPQVQTLGRRILGRKALCAIVHRLLTPPHHEAPPAAPQLEKHAMPQISLSLASLGGALDSSEHAVNGHEALNTGLGGDGPAHEELPHVQVDVTSSASSVSQPLEGKSVGLAAESPPPPAVEDIRLRLARSLHVLKEVRRRSSMSGDSNAANVRESGLSTVGASPLSTETAPRRGMEQAAQLSRRSH